MKSFYLSILFFSTTLFSYTQCTTSSIVVVEPSCQGAANGSIYVSTTGGVPPYQVFQPGTSIPMPYTSDIFFTGLVSGVYTISVTDFTGCVEIQTVNIFEPPPLFVMTSSTPESVPGACDGTIFAIASGGTPGYIYSVTPPLPGVPPYTNVCAGTYTVSAVDSYGCQNSVPIIVTTCAAVTNTTIVAASCNSVCDGFVTVSSAGGLAPYSLSGNFSGSPLTFTTSTVLPNLCAGIYDLINTDANGCVENFSITVLEPSLITANATDTDASTPGLCNGTLSGSFNGGDPPYVIAWVNCATGFSSGSQLNVTNICSGDYQLIITDANGCSDSSECINVADSIANVGFEENEIAFNIYPNPAAYQLIIESTTEIFRLEIINTLGEVVYFSNTIFSGATSLSLHQMGLTEGLYVVRLFSGATISAIPVVILAH